MHAAPRPDDAGHLAAHLAEARSDESGHSAAVLRAANPHAIIDGCPMLPADNIWNARVDNLPIDPQSAAYVNTIGAGTGVHADFGSGLWNNGPIGIPYITVAGDQARVPLSFRWPGESDAGPYPIPTDAPIEGPPNGNGDRHILVVDRDTCVLYEVYNAYWEPDGSIGAGSGAIFDLNSNALRTAGWTSADAAGLPILPGLVRYDEVASGVIDHAVRFTVPETRAAYVWPGRHLASDLQELRYPPMGQRFRLKAGVPTGGFSTEAKTIAQAFKTYGMILADNGSAWFVSGVPDERWDNDALRDLGGLRGSDFEAVDVSSLMVHPDSGQVPGGVPSATPSPTSVASVTPGSDTPTATASDTPTSPPSETATAPGSETPTAPPLDTPTATPPDTTPGIPTLTPTSTGPDPATWTPMPSETATEPTPSPEPTAVGSPGPATPPGGTWRLFLPSARFEARGGRL